MSAPSPPLRQLLATNLGMAESVAARLQSSLKRIGGMFPLKAGQLTTLSAEEMDGLDAFLKRFEQLTDLLQARLFRTIASLDGEDVASLSRRDVAHFLDRTGALASADEWFKIVLLRNVLSHEYPGEEARQIERLNMAFSAGPALVETLQSLRSYVQRKGLLA